MSIEDHSREHYYKVRYRDEYPDLGEAQPDYKNVGWSIGNRCHLKCNQCYSRSARDMGQNIDIRTIDLIIDQLQRLSVETVNLGGNEPIYTNGIDPKHSKLPYIIDSLTSHGMKVGITSAGPTILALAQFFPDSLRLLNDVDLSLDSPYQEEHDDNRGQQGIFRLAMRALGHLEKNAIPRTLIMCAMSWNFTPDRISSMIRLAKDRGSNVRFNPMKPVEITHLPLVLSAKQFYQGLECVLQQCDTLDISDPAWAVAGKVESETVSGCPCGVNSFRIHSITPDGQIPVSPCVYLHDHKYGDLSKQSLTEILNSPPFKEYRRRKQNPEFIDGCKHCDYMDVCGGGCAARAYLHSMYEDDKNRSIFKKDPYCPMQHKEIIDDNWQANVLVNGDLVHMGYLCTGIFKPR